MIRYAVRVMIVLYLALGSDVTEAAVGDLSHGNLCEPLTLSFTVLSVGLTGHTISVAAMKGTVPLLSIEVDGSLSTTRWVLLTSESPEIVFLKMQQSHLQNVRHLLGYNYTFLSVRYECHFSSVSFCGISYFEDFNLILEFNSHGKQRLTSFNDGNKIKSLASGSGVTEFLNHVSSVHERWSVICENISRISTSEYVNGTFRRISGSSSICEMRSPSPIKFWLVVYDSNANVWESLQSTFGGTESSVSLTVNATESHLICVVHSILGWNISLPLVTDIDRAPQHETNLTTAIVDHDTGRSNITLTDNINTNETVKVDNAKLFYHLLAPALLLILTVICFIFKHKFRLLFMELVARRYRNRNWSLSRTIDHMIL
uniref:Membrane protein a151 n=1 Tax=Mastomys natalensis cytomegalovirus 2 TaxID=2973540 RepID=A0A9Y1N6Z5_9BETA|nr:membrane protein a151 [Mastomys natalensis cytomegalovirus 2]WEG69277.1 membrane protein a151 [Mastomys natalensis cytomegalovirus 2]WEG69416.1 membrane protein a151 [Mastomys natalensis cytomegalovirus 2]WEG69554.1 membrane protein a151 [Mastomys natalensis cytomegalovirus 2]WEG69692.1 membrane protein a151 [Mastomys natalensis cytomegalovirus 2]